MHWSHADVLSLDFIFYKLCFMLGKAWSMEDVKQAPKRVLSSVKKMADNASAFA